ncbi:MAG TPA: tetratricopeptide repeat protein [Bacteroidota bacterium]|nr:tetratricopeptide repeat protein [Bacteroidota bacterium]
MSITFRRAFFFMAPAVLAVTFANAQKPDNNIKFRLAQSYEHSGDFDAALNIYGELYERDSTSVVIFDALRRNYLLLKRYDDLITLFNRSLVRNPHDMSVLAQLGTFYTLKSDDLNASRCWERAISVDSIHEVTYRVVGSSLTESRLFERAIEIYRRGRRACNNPALFTMDIAYLQSIVMNFGEATREYINLIRQTPSMLSFAQTRIASYTARPQGLPAAIGAVEEAVKSEPDNLPLIQLQAWVYMEGKQFDRAYDVYKIIDAKTNAAGRELYNFGEHALKEKSYAAAARAFRDVITIHPKFEMLPQAKFGYARTLEESTATQDTLYQFSVATGSLRPVTASAPMYNDVIAAYRQVTAEFPTTEFAAQSLLRIAILQQERFFDLDGVKSTLETLTKTYAAFPAITIEGTLRFGDLYLAKGDLPRAEEQYLLLNHYGGGGDQRERGALRLAEIDYFKGNFKEALKRLRDLTRNVASDIANDALKLQVLIMENTRSGDAALRELSKAEFLKRQMKFSDALKAYESILASDSTSDLIDEVLMNVGDIHVQNREYAEGIASYDKLLSSFPESLVLDLTLMKIGNAYRYGLHNVPHAIEAYQRLLEKFPNSIYATVVRKYIRELRGDNI